MRTQVVLLVILVWIEQCLGHGYMKDPTPRNFAMLANTRAIPDYKECTTGRINYDAQSKNCGGRGVQIANGGKCGACGDNYSYNYPRSHDFGGAFANKITPTRLYLKGQHFSTEFRLTQQHKGNVQYRLCNINEASFPGEDRLTQCFSNPNEYLVLPVQSGRDQSWGSTYDGTKANGNAGLNITGTYKTQVQLPPDFTCKGGCSIQWWYEAGNSGPGTPGKDEEHFVNCADIIIVDCSTWKNEMSTFEWCGLGPTPQLLDCDPSQSGNTNQYPTDNNYPTNNNDLENQNNVNPNPTTGGTQKKPKCKKKPQDQASNDQYPNNNNGYDDTYTSNNNGYDDTYTSNNNGYNANNDAYNPSNNDAGQSQDHYGTTDTNDWESNNNQPTVASSVNPTTGNIPTSANNANDNGSTFPKCSECTDTCSNPCCVESLTYTSISHIPDSWCQMNCQNVPPNCPATYCQEEVKWESKVGCARAIGMILRELDMMEGLADTKDEMTRNVEESDKVDNFPIGRDLDDEDEYNYLVNRLLERLDNRKRRRT